jgi:cell division protein FtsB
MTLLSEIRRRSRLVVGPVLGITLAGYFAYHLVQGDRGLIAWLRLTQQIREAKVSLDRVEGERQALDRRVNLLRSDHLDRDMLDERARSMLNLVGPNEVVIFNAQPRR